ncbi:MAG TPA: hypothetical protein VFV38_27220 [Ktedonobacteraceae bacterium]|nr:hypothetical protein [Ktedonobacteraceae bacterium]
MGDMDQAMKRLVHLRGPDLLALVVPGEVFKRLLPTEPAAEPQLMLDSLVLAEVNAEECLVDIEFQTDLDKTMPRRMFEYGARASIVQQKPVISVVVWLEKGRGKIPASPYQMQAGRYKLATWPFISIELYKIPASSATIHSGGLGVSLLVPFMQGADEQAVEEAMRRVREEAPAEQSIELASLLAVFIDRKQGTDLALKILRRFGMASDILRQSDLVKPLLVEEDQEMARAALEGRFGQLDEEIIQALGRADKATLLELLRHVETLEQLRAKLEL